MKKVFMLLAVMAALIFSAAPSQALLGMPDDVPGKDVILPFLVSMPGNGNVNTLLVLTDVYGGWTNKAPVADFHYTVYTKKSETVYNDDAEGTPYDIIAFDAYTITTKMAPVQLAKLAVDLDGDTVMDHYAGYIYFEGLNLTNTTIGEMWIVDILGGMAANANAAVKEYAPKAICPQMFENYGSETNAQVELFSANALAAAKSVQDGLPCVDAIGIGLFPRYYIVDEVGGKSYLIIWKSTNEPKEDLHVLYYNNNEDYVSSNIPLPYELNIINIEPYLPVSLHSGYPKEGWIAITTADLDGAGFDGAREWLGYTWNKAVGSAAESWNVLSPMHRDAWYTEEK